MQKYWEPPEQSGYRYSVGWYTVLAFTTTGILAGAIPTWNEGDGCMIPYGFIPVVAGVLCGALGLVIGLIAAPIAVSVDKGRRDRMVSRRGGGDTDGSANLLRPICQRETGSLLRPAPTSRIESSNPLLLPTEAQGDDNSPGSVNL